MENLKWKSPRTYIILVVVLGVIATMIVAIARDRRDNQQIRQVTINGQGKVSYEPDLAIVTMGVQIDKAPKADEALKQLNDKVAKIITAVKAQQVDDADITTSNYSLYAQYDYKDNVSNVSGYNANEQLIIKVRSYDKDTEKLNRVIDAASKAGANQMSGLTFDISNLNDVKQVARLRAIEDAKNKSRSLADFAGVRLGDLISWWENDVQVPGPSMNNYGAGGMGAGGGGAVYSQTPSGVKEVVIEMNLTYEIK